MYKLSLEKAEEPGNKLPTFVAKVRMVSIKKSTTINAGEGMKEKEPSSLLVGMKVSKSMKEKRRKVH